MESTTTNGFDHKRKISGSVNTPKRLKKENPVDNLCKLSALPKEKETYVSLLDSFAPEEIEVHLQSLNPSTNKSQQNEICCQLCGLGELNFKIPPIYCSPCKKLFTKGSNWKSIVEDDIPYNFCNLCLKNARQSKTISCGTHSFSKEKLQPGVTYEKIGEPWVLCGNENCKMWQHQICALFNPERDKDKEAMYTCPKCRINELKTTSDECVPISTPAFGARHLPKTKLSDHIENRLCKSLLLERNQRAKALGKSPNEVPEAKDLVVRMVLSVKKELTVTKEYLDIIRDEPYPAKMPYTSKAILLFQKIDGVEVCLLAIYVDEFGSECAKPNQRTVYISYLDSVKYFTPEVTTINGESLRTFLYQEILIGYFDYCNQRGFTTCYIWSCPPKKGDDDYILNCHPATQHTPKPAHLRNWYKLMLKKAKEQNVIAGYTNFCNKFMEAKSEKITAARLPYFDGAYWSGFIEGELKSMKNDNEDAIRSKVFQEGLAKKVNNDKVSAKNALVMSKLKENMKKSKDDFFVVNLRTEDLTADTEDGDEVMQNDFMDTRKSYFSFCQRKNYQFDTLRRAKHKTMLTLYHIHKEIHVEPTLHQKSGGSDLNVQKLCQKNKNILDVLTHANSCRAKRDTSCSYLHCFRVKSLFHHSKKCETHVAGGCERCRKIWFLIKLHCQHCKDPFCDFPRCMDMKNNGRAR